MIRDTSGIIPSEVEYEMVNSELANVWINKNIEETYIELEDSPRETLYQYDQVFFTVNPNVITKADILNDVDFYFTNTINLNGENADYLSVDNVREKKKAEISQTCQDIITNGVDVMISGKIQHFSLTEFDQINLMGLQTMVMTGSEWIPYHCDGQPCIYYSLADATTILNKAMSHKIYHTTYCNSVFNWINHLEKPSQICAITYGDVIPQEYQSDVLKDLLG